MDTQVATALEIGKFNISCKGNNLSRADADNASTSEAILAHGAEGNAIHDPKNWPLLGTLNTLEKLRDESIRQFELSK